MNDRKIQALRNLAERPGTPAEGEVARQKLEEALKAGPKPRPASTVLSGFSFSFSGHFSDAMFADVAERVAAYWDRAERPVYQHASITCWCSSSILRQGGCAYARTHEARIFKIRFLLRQRFVKGERVYYNAHAYPDNSRATVVGYAKIGTWIRLKFDYLKTIRSVPSLYGNLWMLSVDPLSPEQILKRQGGSMSAP